MVRQWLPLGLLPLAMIVVASLACEDTSHVYVGRLFVEERGCLGTATSVDVVEGDPPGECEPTCLAQSQSDGGRAIYVATMCPPFPFGFDVSGSDPACPDALAALARADTCRVDGGSTNPAPLRDAASD